MLHLSLPINLAELHYNGSQRFLLCLVSLGSCSLCCIQNHLPSLADCVFKQRFQKHKSKCACSEHQHFESVSCSLPTVMFADCLTFSLPLVLTAAPHCSHWLSSVEIALHWLFIVYNVWFASLQNYTCVFLFGFIFLWFFLF